jgi:hypothetical protein
LDPLVAARDFDVVLLGTSPLMMIQALHFHHQGRRVALLERADRIGGSWYTRDLWQFKNVEFSVHELLCRPRAYRLLRESLGLELVPERGAYGLWGPRRIPLSRYRLVARVRSIGPHVRARSWMDLWDKREEAWRDLRFAGMAPQYLAGGARVLLQRLLDMLGRAGVPILRGTTAREVDLDADLAAGVCRTSAGDLRFSRFVIGQSAHCPIKIAGVPFAFETRLRGPTTIFLHVQGEGLELAPFMTHDDPRVRRFRSIGSFVDPPLPEGQLMLALASRASEYSREDAAESTAHALLERLISLGAIAPGAKLLNFHFENYVLDQIAKTEIRRMAKRLVPAVLAMETWDLAECLETRARDPRVLSLPPYEA